MSTARDTRTTLEQLANNLQGVMKWANTTLYTSGIQWGCATSPAGRALQDLSKNAYMLREAILTDLTTANNDPSMLDSMVRRVRDNVASLLVPIGSYVPPDTISSRHFIVDEAIAPDSVGRDYLGIAIDKVLDRLWKLPCTDP